MHPLQILTPHLILIHLKFHYLDLYRLKNEYEALDSGLEEILDSKKLCFIEWPEKIANLLPQNLLRIHIEFEANVRIFTIEEIKS